MGILVYEEFEKPIAKHNEKKWPEWEKAFERNVIIIKWSKSTTRVIHDRDSQASYEDATCMSNDCKLVPTNGFYANADAQRVHTMISSFVHGQHAAS